MGGIQREAIIFECTLCDFFSRFTKKLKNPKRYTKKKILNSKYQLSTSVYNHIHYYLIIFKIVKIIFIFLFKCNYTFVIEEGPISKRRSIQ